MKSFLLPASILLAFGSYGGSDRLELGFEEDDVLTRTFEANAEYGIDEITISFDDEEQTNDEVEFSIESLERIVVRDEILEVDDGRPTDFRRTFVELLQEATITQAEEEFESTSISDLEGVTVRFLWDDDDEDYFVELDDDEERVDEELLETLAADMDFALLLPDDELEQGDEWEFDGRAYLVLMWPGGVVSFYDEEQQEEANAADRELNHQTIENLEGDGTAVLEEIRDEDGVRVAVIKLEIDVETSAESEDDEGITLELDYERQIQGEVLWDLEHGHILSASFEAESEWTRTRSGEVEFEDGTHDISEATTYSGTIEYEVEFERE